MVEEQRTRYDRMDVAKQIGVLYWFFQLDPEELLATLGANPPEYKIMGINLLKIHLFLLKHQHNICSYGMETPEHAHQGIESINKL